MRPPILICLVETSGDAQRDARKFAIQLIKQAKVSDIGLVDFINRKMLSAILMQYFVIKNYELPVDLC